MMDEIYDVVGVGFGPANIALAVSLEETGFSGEALFLEENEASGWQTEMLLPSTDIQHNPLRDFATPCNPRSKHGFLSYLHEKGRLWDYLNLASSYPPRSEYAEYVRWVADKFEHCVEYGRRVISIVAVKRDGEELSAVTIDGGRTVLARCLSLGCGRSPYIPEIYRGLNINRVAHTRSYLSTLKLWRRDKSIRRIAVIGASQSAAEVVLHLADQPESYQIFNITRDVGYRQKDVSPFTETIYYPLFVDQYYYSSEQNKRSLDKRLRNSNYGAADADVIQKINFKLYEQSAKQDQKLNILSNTAVNKVYQSDCETLTLEMVDLFSENTRFLTVDAIFLATGFRNLGGQKNQECYPALLKDLVPILKCRGDGAVFVTRGYQVIGKNQECRVPTIFLNGLCESSRGFGDAGSFSLLAVRSREIVNGIYDKLNVRIEQNFKSREIIASV